MWHGKVETDASEKWGKGLFITLIVFMMIFACMLTGPFFALLYFQLQLIRRSCVTGAPEKTYMYTPNRDGKMRGLSAYLDVAILQKVTSILLCIHVSQVQSLVLKLHPTQHSLFQYWKVFTEHSVDQRNKVWHWRRGLFDGWWQQQTADRMSSVQRHALNLANTGPLHRDPWLDGDDIPAGNPNDVDDDGELEPLIPDLPVNQSGGQLHRPGEPTANTKKKGKKPPWWCC